MIDINENTSTLEIHNYIYQLMLGYKGKILEDGTHFELKMPSRTSWGWFFVHIKGKSGYLYFSNSDSLEVLRFNVKKIELAFDDKFKSIEEFMNFKYQDDGKQ